MNLKLNKSPRHPAVQRPLQRRADEWNGRALDRLFRRFWRDWEQRRQGEEQA